MAFWTPPGYYDNYDPSVKSWFEVLFNPSKGVQSQELNSLQTILAYRIKQLADSLYQDGTWWSGGSISVVPGGANQTGQNPTVVSFTAGVLYANGGVHNVPAGSVNITGVGIEVVGLLISTNVITSVNDSALLDPAVGTQMQGVAAADRLSFTYLYVLNNPAAIPIATFDNGQLVQTTSGNTLLDQILAILADRTYQQSGSFLTQMPKITFQDPSGNQSQPTQISVQIEGGIGFVQGWEFKNKNRVMLSLERPLATTSSTASEPHTYTTGTNVYALNNSPVYSITQFQSTIQSASTPNNRAASGYIDALPGSLTNIVSIISITQGGTTYQQDTGSGGDFIWPAIVGGFANTNYIQWKSSGTIHTIPTPGSTYYVVVQENYTMQKGARVLTSITGETHLVTSVTTTPLNQQEIAQLQSVTQGGTTYVNGTDFTINMQTGVVSWNINPGGTVTFNYTYWVHSVEGDFLCRDSFLDQHNNVLYNLCPTYPGSTGTGTIDYTHQFYLTSAGQKPVNSTSMEIEYNWTMPRADVLVWNLDGTFSILQGIPSVTNPLPPAASDNQLPVMQFMMPAEAFAKNVIQIGYNNMTMKNSDLRALANQVNTINFNEAQFQLAQNTYQDPSIAVTDKLGVFADPFATPAFADTWNTLFSGSFDFLARTFQLPRNTGSKMLGSPTLTSCSQQQDLYMLNYTEQEILVQPFETGVSQVNEYGGVNLRAKITLNPSVDTSVLPIFTTVNAQAQGGVSEETTYTVIQPTYGYGIFANGSGQLTYASDPGYPTGGPPPTSWQGTPVVGPGGGVWLGNVGGSPGAIIPQTTIVATPGTALKPENIINRDLLQNAAPVAPAGNQLANGSGGGLQENPILSTIPIQQNWLNAISSTGNGQSSTGVVQQNQWATVLQNVSVAPLQYCNPTVVTVTGSTFIGNEAGIGCTIDNIPVALTSTGSGSWHNDSSMPGCMVADSLGNFQATFTVPMGVPVGKHVIQVTGHNTGSSKVVTSMATTTYVASAYVEDISEFVSFAYDFTASGDNYYTLSAYALCNVMNFQPNQAVLAAAGPTGTIASMIAEAVIQAQATPTATYNQSTFIAGLAAAFAWMQYTPAPTAAVLQSVWSAIPANCTSPSQIANAILAAVPGFSKSPYALAPFAVDPVGQTFTPPNDCFVTSVQIYCANTPASNVGVALAATTAGFPNATHITEVWLTPGSISTSGPTKFTFDKPVFLKGGQEYSFVVMCDDVAFEIYTAQTGGTDPDLGLVLKNPSTGTMLKSPNGSTWALMGGYNIKFIINAAQFTSTSGTIDFGNVTLPISACRISLNMPFSLPSPDCFVQPQYSLDGITWVNFPTLLEQDFGQLQSTCRIRVQLTGSATMSPCVSTTAFLQAFSWKTSGGCYVHRELQMPTADVTHVDLYIDALLPSTTSITPHIEFPGDDAYGWWPMVLQGDTINLANGFTTYHWKWNATDWNQETIVIGTGSGITVGDTLSITLTGSYTGSPVGVHYQVQAGDTTTAILAQKLVSNTGNTGFNNITALQNANVFATVSGSTITVFTPASESIAFSNTSSGITESITLVNNGNVDKQHVIARCDLATGAAYLTPTIQNFRFVIT